MEGLINNEDAVKKGSNIVEGERKENEISENLNVEELNKNKEILDSKINEAEEILKSMENEILILQEKIPKVDGTFVDREYKHFADGLGDTFKNKLDTLISIQKDMSNDFIQNNLSDKDKEDLSKSIKSMQTLIDRLRVSKTDNENFDNQQLVKYSRSALDLITGAYNGLKYIKKYNGYIDKYLEEKRGLNQYINKLDNDPKNIEIKKQIYDLGESYQTKSKERQSMQMERNEIDKKIKDIQNKI
jgi:hypothetical protein